MKRDSLAGNMSLVSFPRRMSAGGWDVSITTGVTSVTGLLPMRKTFRAGRLGVCNYSRSG